MPAFTDRVEIHDVVCIGQTGKAILCRLSEEYDNIEVWIPQSQVDDDSEVYEEGGEGVLVVSLWIAEEKGII